MARPGRPPGEVRRAMLTALQERGPMPLRVWSATSQVGYSVARCAVQRMVNKDIRVQAERVRLPGATQRVRVYELVPDSKVHDTRAHDPFKALQHWALQARQLND